MVFTFSCIRCGIWPFRFQIPQHSQTQREELKLCTHGTATINIKKKKKYRRKVGRVNNVRMPTRYFVRLTNTNDDANDSNDPIPKVTLNVRMHVFCTVGRYIVARVTNIIQFPRSFHNTRLHTRY